MAWSASSATAKLLMLLLMLTTIIVSAATTAAAEITQENVKVESFCAVNGVKDGAETDVDCGGPICPKCADTLACAVDADCASSICDGDRLTCTPEACADGTRNGGETDVDCGGAACGGCADGHNAHGSRLRQRRCDRDQMRAFQRRAWTASYLRRNGRRLRRTMVRAVPRRVRVRSRCRLRISALQSRKRRLHARNVRQRRRRRRRSRRRLRRRRMREMLRREKLRYGCRLRQRPMRLCEKCLPAHVVRGRHAQRRRD